MKKCKCGSYSINPKLHGRDNTDLDLCDVCYWRKRAESQKNVLICGGYTIDEMKKCINENESLKAENEHLKRKS